MKEDPGANQLSDLPKRALVNGISAVLILIFIFLAERDFFRWIFTTALAAITVFALWEYYQLVKRKGFAPAMTLGIVGTILYIFAVFYKTQGPHFYGASFWHNAPEIVLGLVFFGCFVFFAIKAVSPIVNIAATFFGMVYIAIPLALFLRIAYFFSYGGMGDPFLEGSWWLLYLIAVTKSADMGGYFFGRRFGRHKLAFKLSPNKTLEGAIGGLFSSMAMGLFLCFLGKSFGNVFLHFTYLESFFLNLLIGILGQLGDLAESLLKRDAGVKDSNRLPGVGGILDMVDSLLFTSPVVYIFIKVHYT